MKRIAIIFSIISVILLVYGLIDYLTNYNWAQGDQDPLFGNQNVLLNDGATVLIAGGLLTVGSVIMWILALRKGDGDHQP
jgi:CHASE3 domain sensor protein